MRILPARSLDCPPILPPPIRLGEPRALTARPKAQVGDCRRRSGTRGNRQDQAIRRNGRVAHLSAIRQGQAAQWAVAMVCSLRLKESGEIPIKLTIRLPYIVGGSHSERGGWAGRRWDGRKRSFESFPYLFHRCSFLKRNTKQLSLLLCRLEFWGNSKK